MAGNFYVNRMGWKRWKGVATVSKTQLLGIKHGNGKYQDITVLNNSNDCQLNHV